MELLFLLLFILSFVGYYFSFFSYSSYIFNVNKFPVLACVVCGVINLVFWYLYVFYVSVEHEPLFMLLYAAVLLIETKIVFKKELIPSLFISVTFCINLFAKRMIALSVVALFNDGLVVDTITDHTIASIVAIICFTLSISTINLARKMISRSALDTILADTKNLSFLTAAFSVLFVIIFAFQQSMRVDTGGNELLYHYIILGLFVINAFAVFILFAYSSAELRISTETFRLLKKKNTEDIQQLEKIQKDALTDVLTGLYSRDYADERINAQIADSSLFFVAFVDLDGLKIVNDNYGHEEGDFYIVTVADILKEFFSENTICRYGGDEIVVIGNYKKEDEVTKRLIQCYKSVTKIPKIYKKKYTTSISYGVAFHHPKEHLTASQLIAIADSRMYELKKSNKRHRKVVDLKA